MSRPVSFFLSDKGLARFPLAASYAIFTVIFTAASHAQKAVDYLHGLNNPKPEEALRPKGNMGPSRELWLALRNSDAMIFLVGIHNLFLLNPRGYGSMNNYQETILTQAVNVWFDAHDMHAARMEFLASNPGDTAKRMTEKSRAMLNMAADHIDALCEQFGVGVDQRAELMENIGKERADTIQIVR